MAEPLMTMFTFSQSAYTDSKTSNAIVVTITREDQDPVAQSEAFTVGVNMTGGDAVENRDFTLKFDGAIKQLGKITFAPGVRKQSFTILTHKVKGPNRTITLALSDPEGPTTAVTGGNPTAQVTIVNQ